MKLTKGGKPKWRCLQGAQCSHEEVTAMPSHSNRYSVHPTREVGWLHLVCRVRREVAELAELAEVEREDDEELLAEICQDDTGKCSEMLDRLGSVRHRRSVREEEEDEEEDATEEELLAELCEDDVSKCGEVLEQLFTVPERGGKLLQQQQAGAEGEVKYMRYTAQVVSLTPSSLTFLPPALPAGRYRVLVGGVGRGRAVSTLPLLTSSLALHAVSPGVGSVCGGQNINITGTGFCPGDTVVTIAGQTCNLTRESPGLLGCSSPGGPPGPATLAVISCGQMASTTFNYSTSATPTVTSLSPGAASGAASLALTGLQFGSSPVVRVGSAECVVSRASESSISCSLAALPAGELPVTVYNTELGISCPGPNTTFTSELSISSLSPAAGSHGGGSVLVVTGAGFHPELELSLCGEPCQVVNVTTEKVVCLTPASMSNSSLLACNLTLAQQAATGLGPAFTYDLALTAMVDSVSPGRGGTGGGTLLTISGQGFAVTGNKVTVAGSVCDIASQTSGEITCYTNTHSGSVRAPVVVEVPGQGHAAYSDPTAAEFYYIDRWNSIWTWGGLGTPQQGEFIVITEVRQISL